MCSSSDIGVDGIGVFLDLFSKFVERFEGGFTTNGSEVRSLKNGVLVINVARNGG